MDKLKLTAEDLDKEVDIENKSSFVVATLGRACKNPETLIKMIDAGMNICRLRL
jgi:pyruvate kinase